MGTRRIKFGINPIPDRHLPTKEHEVFVFKENDMDIIKSDVSQTYHKQSIGIEIREQAELDKLIKALLADKNESVVLENQHGDIRIHFYLRFRESMRSGQ